MKKLGQYLVEKGWLTVPQVKQALQHQRVFGGRLGTCLLELNLLSEDRLTRALSDVLSLPAVSVEALRNVDVSARDLVPARMACKSRVVVFEAYATEASVCLLDAKDLLLQDELSFVVSKRLKFHVAPEVRIMEALERFYNCDVEARYHRIWDRLNRARYLWQEEKPARGAEAPVFDDAISGRSRGDTAWAPQPPPDFYTPEPATILPPVAPTTARPAESSPVPVEPGVHASPSAAEAPLSPAAVSTPPPAASQHPAAVPEVDVVSETGSTRPIEPVEVPADAEALRVAMEAAGERDRIVSLLLVYLRERFDRVVMFMVRAGEIVGWMGAGPGVQQEGIDGFVLEFDRPSLFLNLREGSPFFRGPLLRMDAHHDLASLLGGRWPKDCAAIPLKIRDRLVGVVYVDQGGAAMQDADLGELQRLGSITGKAFESFLVRRKKDQQH